MKWALACVALCACGGGPVATDAGADASSDAFVPLDGGPDAGPPTEIMFPGMGPIAGPAGRGSFRFGVATAATQIEDQNTTTDWYAWTAPPPDGLGNGTFVGDAVRGYTNAVADVALLAQLNVDSYRFSIEWARIEPMRNVISSPAIVHYHGVLDALHNANIAPNVTLFHFSNPTWVDDPRQSDCSGGPTDAWLCGWGDDAGGPLIIAEFADHACRMASEYGDRVDDWATINEPVNYLFASYGTTQFPPGRNLALTDFPRFMNVVRNFVAAHAAAYDAIKRCDTMDADGDGVAANVGLTLSVAEWVPAFNNRPSTRPADLMAVDRIDYVFHYLFIDSILNGTFDADLDGTAEETHSDWTNRLDWLGVQYYFRAGVTSQPAILPVVNLTPCTGPLDLGACLRAADPTHFVPVMNYEYYEPGLYDILTAFSARWPHLPLTVTESGIATTVGRRRAEQTVRTLEQIARARADGVDVRGYYHWSLMDNFEWALGYAPQFGLYSVDRTTYARSPTEGATVFGAVAGARRLTIAQRTMYGGLGPMTPEP